MGALPTTPAAPWRRALPAGAMERIAEERDSPGRGAPPLTGAEEEALTELTRWLSDALHAELHTEPAQAEAFIDRVLTSCEARCCGVAVGAACAAAWSARRNPRGRAALTRPLARPRCQALRAAALAPYQQRLQATEAALQELLAGALGAHSPARAHKTPALS